MNCTCPEDWQGMDHTQGCKSRARSQAGPLMVRRVIDGHEVLLPADAKLHKPLKPGDAIDDHPLGGTY